MSWRRMMTYLMLVGFVLGISVAQHQIGTFWAAAVGVLLMAVEAVASYPGRIRGDPPE
jgi:hypothetical protein